MPLFPTSPAAVLTDAPALPGILSLEGNSAHALEGSGAVVLGAALPSLEIETPALAERRMAATGRPPMDLGEFG